MLISRTDINPQAIAYGIHGTTLIPNTLTVDGGMDAQLRSPGVDTVIDLTLPDRL